MWAIIATRSGRHCDESRPTEQPSYLHVDSARERLGKFSPSAANILPLVDYKRKCREGLLTTPVYIQFVFPSAHRFVLALVVLRCILKTKTSSRQTVAMVSKGPRTAAP